MSQHRLLSRRSVCRTLALAGAGLLVRPAPCFAETGGLTTDRIVVLKSSRLLILMNGGRALGTFPIALGFHPKGPKRRQGDGRTPEGRYEVDGLNPDSHYWRALHINYPNAEDVRRARAAGVDPGDNIEIHGMPARFGNYNPTSFPYDWTNGCIAVSNPVMDRIWACADIGTVVEILA